MPPGSLRLDLPAALLGPFDAGRLVFPWRHLDPKVDALQAAVLEGHGGGVGGAIPGEDLRRGLAPRRPPVPARLRKPAEAAGGVPHLLEPWFCCAEPAAVRLGVPAATLI